MPEQTVTFHGAAMTVTGSCYEIISKGRHILIDCGLFQGSRTLEALNHSKIAFDVAAIDGIILTHSHLDHSGLVPKLVANGYSGPIWCTEPTIDLLEHMWRDAARIEEQDTERRNRRADRADEKPITPIYTAHDAEKALGLLSPVALKTAFEPAPGFSAKLWNAGHILGSASVEVTVENTRLLFSGDIGPEFKAFQKDPDSPTGLDHVFCESTYGDRTRESLTIKERRAQLYSEISMALAQGGNLIMPVFALERTQEILLDIAHLLLSKTLKGINIFIDSPLASRITAVFSRHKDLLDDIDGAEIFNHPSFHFVEDAFASRKLNDLSGAIILAASGMCEGGRIRYHLEANLPRHNSAVLFVGYQAQGTLGRIIRDGAKRVRISGHDVAVRATIKAIDSYSAHADRTELLGWIDARKPITGSLFLTHGEPASITALKQRLMGEIDSIIAPGIGDINSLPRASAAKLLHQGSVRLQENSRHDWQNDYADFSVSLKHELRAIEDEKMRQQAIHRMRAILASYQHHRETHTAK